MTHRWPCDNFPALLQTRLGNLVGLSHVSVFHVGRFNTKHTWNSHTLPQNNTPKWFYPICGVFLSPVCNCPGKRPQQGGTIEDISSGFPLWRLLFSSPPIITCTTGGLLCGITRANGATHFCCRKSDSRAVTAKTVIKKPKLHHDVGHFGRERREKKCSKWSKRHYWPVMGCVNFVSWSCSLVCWILTEK